MRSFTRPTETFTFHVANPSPALHDRSVIVPTGRALGGGSSINCMKLISSCSMFSELKLQSSCLLRKSGGLGLRRLGKCLWE